MRQVAEAAWLLTFDDADERLANRRARAAFHELLRRDPPGLVDSVPAARSLLVVGALTFDPAALAGLERVDAVGEGGAPAVHEILVTLDGEDVSTVLGSSGHSKDAFEKTVLETRFTVGFLGFLPGFAYLYGLPPALHVPRRASPRGAVPRNALAVAGPYAAIYPSKSPGGWNLVGTALPPWPLFEPTRDRPNLFSPGDEIRFVPA